MLSDARLVASAKASESKLELLHLQHSSFTFFFFFFWFLATSDAANLAAISIADHHYAFLWSHLNCINIIWGHCFFITIMGITRYKPRHKDSRQDITLTGGRGGSPSYVNSVKWLMVMIRLNSTCHKVLSMPVSSLLLEHCCFSQASRKQVNTILFFVCMGCSRQGSLAMFQWHC